MGRDIKSAIAINIKCARKEKMTQKELAKKISKSIRMVQKYEDNEVTPSFEVLLEIAEALKVSLFDLIPVKKGKWIKGDVKWHCDCEWNCSVCGDVVSLLEGDTPKKAELKFYSNCGADMREDKDE